MGMANLLRSPEISSPLIRGRADPAGRPRGARFSASTRAGDFRTYREGFDVGYGPDSRARGMAIVNKTDREQMLRVAAAIEVAKEGGKVGVVGFCLGGTIAWAAAGRLPGLSAAVGYYGGGIIGLKDLKNPACRPSCTSARRTSTSRSRACANSRPPILMSMSTSIPYPADHGFNCDQRESYDAPSAAFTWTRTLAFLAKHLG
jgi:carboxymethylenebutenolidase